jgi:type I restriction enzyme S subunit
MKKMWPQVKLDELLIPVSRPESVDPAKTYHILGSHWYAKGLYTKDVLTGTGIQAPRVYRVKKGDFVYNRLFAWKGSFALSSDENDGCYVSNEFPCFSVNVNRLEGKYLWLYFSRQSIWNEALGLSTGGTPTSRNRLKEGQLLAMQIPLPPLEKQRRIIARIEELSAKIEEARALRRDAAEEATVLMKAAMRCIFTGGTFKEATLVGVCAAIIDNLHSNPIYAHEGVSCVRSPNIGWGCLELDRALRTSEEEYVRRTVRGEPQKDDIVLVREGGGTGKAAIVEAGQRFSLGQRVMMLRPDKTQQATLSPISIRFDLPIPSWRNWGKPVTEFAILCKALSGAL